MESQKAIIHHLRLYLPFLFEILTDEQRSKMVLAIAFVVLLLLMRAIPAYAGCHVNVPPYYLPSSRQQDEGKVVRTLI